MKKTIVIEGMNCEHCENHTEKELLKIEGVVKAEADADKNQAVVELEKEIGEVEFKSAVKKAGYKYVKTL